MDDKIKQLEIQLDLKDYYEIKRPTVTLFTYYNQQLKVTRIDMLTETQSYSSVKLVNPTAN